MSAILQPFGAELWLADGPIVTAIAGFHYPTRMAVMRLGAENGGAGRLAIWSPTPLTDALRAEVTALGPVRWLIAPNVLHDLSIGDWAAAWPDAALLAPPRLRQARPDLAFTGDLPSNSDQAGPPPAGWGQDLACVIVPNTIAPEAVFFHRPSGTVIFTDLIQHFRPGWFRGWRALVARLDLMTGEAPAVPRKFRAAMRDRAAARAAVSTILAWPAERVVMAHGAPVTTDAPAFLRGAFRWLMG